MINSGPYLQPPTLELGVFQNAESFGFVKGEYSVYTIFYASPQWGPGQIPGIKHYKYICNERY